MNNNSPTLGVSRRGAITIWLNVCFSALAVFFLVSAPSLKLLGVGNAPNLLALVCLVLNVIFSGRMVISRRRYHIMVWVGLILVMLFLASVPVASLWTGKLLFKFIFLLAVLILLPLSFNINCVPYLIFLLSLWAAFLSWWQILYGVPMSREIGQNYLTLSMPIALSLSLMQGLVFFSKSSIGIKVLALGSTLLNLMALSTIISRSGLIHPAIVFIGSMSLLIFVSRNLTLGKKLIYLTGVVLTLALGLYYAINYMDWAAMYRIQHLSDIDDQSRTIIYNKSMGYIAGAPWMGYGIPMIPILYDGVYPHNIFLEVMVSGGILPLLLMIGFVINFLRNYLVCFRSNLTDINCVALFTGAMFLFLQWNTSFSFLDSYIPLSMMIIAILRLKEYLHEK